MVAAMSGQPPSNTPEWSVSDLSGALKRTRKGNSVRVEK